MQPQQMSRADQVRRFVLERIIQPGRAAGRQTVTVRAGDVQRDLGWWNRAPSVCSALDTREFQQMSQTHLVERRGPAQSTTTEWVFALSTNPGANPDPGIEASGRRLIAEWDGQSFRPAAAPQNLQVGQRVVLVVTPAQGVGDLAGRFGSLVGTLSDEEAAEMQEAIDNAFETISDEW
jgi:hypothetical protein